MEVLHQHEIKEHDKKFIKQNEIKTIKVSKSLSNLKKTARQSNLKENMSCKAGAGPKEITEILKCFQNNSWEVRKKGIEQFYDFLDKVDRDNVAKTKGMEELLNSFIEKVNDPHKLLQKQFLRLSSRVSQCLISSKTVLEALVRQLILALGNQQAEVRQIAYQQIQHIGCDQKEETVMKSMLGCLQNDNKHIRSLLVQYLVDNHWGVDVKVHLLPVLKLYGGKDTRLNQQIQELVARLKERGLLGEEVMQQLSKGLNKEQKELLYLVEHDRPPTMQQTRDLPKEESVRGEIGDEEDEEAQLITGSLEALQNFKQRRLENVLYNQIWEEKRTLDMEKYELALVKEQLSEVVHASHLERFSTLTNSDILAVMNLCVDFLGQHPSVLFFASDLLLKWSFIILWGNRSLDIAHMALRFLDWLHHTLTAHHYQFTSQEILILNLIIDLGTQAYELYQLRPMLLQMLSDVNAQNHQCQLGLLSHS